MNSIQHHNESGQKTASINSRDMQISASQMASLHISKVKNASSTILTRGDELSTEGGSTSGVMTAAINISQPPLISLFEEEQLEKGLQLLTGESEIFFDEARLRKLKKKDYPEKYYLLELLFSALSTKASLLRMKLHTAKFIHLQCKKSAQYIEKRRIIDNLEAFFKNASLHDKFLVAYQTKNMHVMPDDISLERMQKLDKHSNIRRENIKGSCQAAEKQYLEFLTMHGIEEIDVMTKLHEFLLSKALSTLIQMFPNLKREIIERNISRADFTFSKVDEKNAISNSSPLEFKADRDPLTQVFWDKLKPEQNLTESEFSKVFCELLYSSFRSDDTVVRNANRKINAAKRKMNTNKAEALKGLYEQYSEKCFRESLCTYGFSVIHYTLKVAFYHESIKEFEALEKNQELGSFTQRNKPRRYSYKSEAFKKLNSKISEAYNLGYKAYQERTNVDWDALSEAEKIAKIEELESKITSKLECLQGYGRKDRKEIPHHLPLISYVLQKLKTDGSIELSYFDDFLENRVSTASYAQRDPETIATKNSQSVLGFNPAFTFEKSVELTPSTSKSKSVLPLVSYKELLPSYLVTKLESDPSYIEQCTAVLKGAMANTAEDPFTRTKCEMLVMMLENVSLKAILAQRAEISKKYNANECVKLPSVEKLVTLLEYFLVGGLKLVRSFSTASCIFAAPMIKLILELFEKSETQDRFCSLLTLKQKIKLGYTYLGIENNKIPDPKAVERFICRWGYEQNAQEQWKMNSDLTQIDIDGISIMATETFLDALPVDNEIVIASDNVVDVPSSPQGVSDNASISLPQISFQEPVMSFSALVLESSQENAQDLPYQTNFATEMVPESPNIDGDTEEMFDIVPRIVFPELMRSPEIPFIRSQEIPDSDESVMPSDVLSFEAPSEFIIKKTDCDNHQSLEFSVPASRQLNALNEENLMLQECELELENKGNVEELVNVFASLDSLSATGQRSLEDVFDFIASDLQSVQQDEETTEPSIDINLQRAKRTATQAGLEDGEFIGTTVSGSKKLPKKLFAGD